MAKVGCLGDIVFQVSDSQIETFSDLSWSGKANYATHAVHLSNSLTEATGLDPETLSFTVKVSAFLGITVADEISKIEKYERNFTALSLVIGEKVIGKYRWNITEHQVNVNYYDKKGNIAEADIALSLQEYVKS